MDQANQSSSPQPEVPVVPAAAAAPVVAPVTAQPVFVSIEDFKKFELRVAKITEVLDHPNADKLYVLKLDVGGQAKQIVAGIKRGYAKEELVGKSIVIINNLQPALLRGVESQGMLLAASDDVAIGVLTPDKPVKSGSVVK
jgi:methionyl-tRNA synthetase